MPASAEDQCFDSRLRHAEVFGDLGVGQAFPLPEQEGPAQVRRHLRQRVAEADQLVVLAVDIGDTLVYLLEVGRVLEPRAPRARDRARYADVLCDLEEPCALGVGNHPLAQRAVRTEERALDGVLRLLTRAQSREAKPIDPRPVALVQKGCLAIRVRRVLNKDFCHVLPC